MSAGFECVLIYAVRHLDLAVPLHTKWNAIEDGLFFKIERGLEVLQSTDWLSTIM